MRRIDAGAYANLVVPALLDTTGLENPDRALVTELVYGATRMRRACDWLVDRFVLRPLDPEVRAVLRLGAYQLAFLGTPPHAAVSKTVDLAPGPARGLVNAVLRRVAEAGPPSWPDDGVRLSYPDWIIERLTADLGADAMAALEQMNTPAVVTRRDDGVVQDRASQWVADLVGAGEGQRIVDLCAGPGGKTTAMARGRPAVAAADVRRAPPAVVVAADVRRARAELVVRAAERLDAGNIAALVADGRRPPIARGAVDRVLVDAPCSGLGVLRRRPDARWRITPDDVDALARLQTELLDGAASLVRPGGLLVYSVCTLTAAETVAVDDWMARHHREFEALAPPGGPWRRHGRGALVLPQTAGTDGMFMARYRRAAS